MSSVGTPNTTMKTSLSNSFSEDGGCVSIPESQERKQNFQIINYYLTQISMILE